MNRKSGIVQTEKEIKTIENRSIENANKITVLNESIGEANGIAQLNNDGKVDKCVTSDNSLALNNKTANNEANTTEKIDIIGMVNEVNTKVDNLGSQSSEELKQLIDYIEIENIHQNLNILDMMLELELLKGSELTGINTNICIEKFDTETDITILNGIYNSSEKRVEIDGTMWIKNIGICYE